MAYCRLGCVILVHIWNALKGSRIPERLELLLSVVSIHTARHISACCTIIQKR